MPVYMHKLIQTSVIRGEDKIVSYLAHGIDQINFVECRVFTVPVSAQIVVYEISSCCRKENYASTIS